MNFRSCGGEMNRTRRLYHSGATDDVAFVVDWLASEFPHVPLGLVGFSLGANVLLKYLGERGAGTAVRVAAAISPPFSLARGVREFESGAGRLYGRQFMKALKAKAIAHGEVAPDAFDLQAVLAARSVQEFDDNFTAPLYGYRDAADYYACNSAAQFLPGIGVPTLILRALDDPFFAHDVPHRAVAENPYLTAGLTPHGGHVAFVEGLRPRRFRYWAERQGARFLAHFLLPADSGND
jgi:predicted alpha/beta-fold hydrolase